MVILESFIRSAGASAESLAALERALDGRAPEFLDFYRRTNGFEMALEPDDESGDLADELDCMRFDEAEFIVEMLPHYAEHHPGALVIGGDAASHLLAFDLRQAGEAPLVVYSSEEEPYLPTCEVIARSFAEFLQRKDIQKALKDAEVMD